MNYKTIFHDLFYIFFSRFEKDFPELFSLTFKGFKNTNSVFAAFLSAFLRYI